MKSCELFQAQLLEHLYGLLEAEESLSLIEHAGRCDACRAALLQADNQRQLLAAGASTACPGAPSADRAKPARAAGPPRPKPPRAARLPRHPGRWAAAAAVLLAVTGVGVPALRYVSAAREHREEAEIAFVDLKQ